MWKTFKQILNKEKFNYSTGYVNPLEFHSIAYYLSRSYGVLDESVPGWSSLLLIFMVSCAVSALTLSALGIFHGWQLLDAAVIIEAGTYTIVLCYMVFILSSVKLNVSDFHALMRILREDYKYVCKPGNKYRERFFESQLQTWKFCIYVATTMATIGIGMVSLTVLALMYYLINRDRDSEEQRPLFFPLWAFEIDFTKSPTYEIMFVYTGVCVIAYCYNYIFIVVTQILWVREIAAKADLVIWGIQDLMADIHPAISRQEVEMFSNIIKHRMRLIIQQHHSMYDLMEHYSQVYKKLLMFEQIFCGPVVCLTAYSAAEKLEYGDINYILILLCFAAVIVAFVPSYLCTFLRIKVSSVANACWDTPFWNAGPVVRPYLVMIVQRSLRPLPLSFGGLKEVSVETFANKMTSAYSCFNMLRQAFK